MIISECNVEGCRSPRYCRNVCIKHYGRLKRYGTTDSQKTPNYDSSGELVINLSERYETTHNSWRAMKERCTNPRSIAYGNYGGKGITVCDEWKTFLGFLDDMGERPNGCTIDRIDNNKGYSKENCKWSTDLEQANNRSIVVKVMINNEVLTLSHYLRKYDIGFSSYYKLYKIVADHQMTADYILANRHKKRYIVNYNKYKESSTL